MRKVSLAILLLILAFSVSAQRRAGATGSKTPTTKASKTTRASEIGQTGIVIDETLSVLRESPSLFAPVVHRMQRGRKVQILGLTEADGVKFYKVAAPPTSVGWVQADAIFGKFRAGDEERFANLVRALDGFDQIEAASDFLEIYPASQLRSSILLLYGDLLEEVAVKLSKDANSKLKRNEMAASAAPLHSYFLNFVSLDRYRKLGIMFLFNSTDRKYHYDGASWREIVTKYPTSTDAVEAKKRLDLLAIKMAPPAK
ncbi:MAG TPA: SH3 domain-containing protein [Pyrinomonadaceae bacterium]|jgi:hypothetical protein|nr:SH3 domain-containing protein [Pyrinomonadaceae bacterium]